jgi:hypothetical protein
MRHDPRAAAVVEGVVTMSPRSFGALAFGLLWVPVVSCSSDPPGAPASADGVDAATASSDASVDGAPRPSTDDSGASVPANAGTTFCLKTIGATLAGLEACCSAAERATSDYTGLAGAAANVQAQCGPSLDDSLASGRIFYDAPAADTCIAAFDAALAAGACHADRLGALDVLKEASCRKAIAGKQVVGQPCGAEYECQDGLTCTSPTRAPEGTCAVPAPVGGACGAPKGKKISLRFGAHRPCVVGSHCDSSSAACVKAMTGECDVDADCTEGDLCIVHHCSKRAKVGETCALPSHCAAGLFCDFVAGTGAGTCAAKRAEGGACDQGFSQCKGVCPKVDGGAAATCKSFCGSG